ncbi:MAG: tetratricopeptide repeat protein, partial [Croceibacterium sp.]
SMAAGKHQQAIGQAEAAVRADPRNAAYRATLGNAYLDLGRFQSADTSFNDALVLGDDSPRTALSRAVALMGQGNLPVAAALLSQWEDRIPAADAGLALALAGRPDRGIQLMSNAIRSGQNDAKLRQNLAYGYALAGRWREARLMASQDLHGEALEARIDQFAAMVQPDAWQTRIASLLGVPAGVRDTGQPVALALANTPGVEQLAAEAAPVAPTVATGGELPALAAAAAPAPVLAVASPPVIELPAAAAPIATSVAAPDAPAPERTFANAFLAPAPAEPLVAALTQDAHRFAAPQRSAAAPLAGTGHLIQLGSFSTEQGAQKAWAIYARKYPELSGHRMVISQAMVGGKHYWRVAADGYGKASSASMCGRVKAGGSGCFAYAAERPLPGAIDTGLRFASR